MNLVCFQYPMIWISWLMSLACALVCSAAPKYSRVFVILSAGSGAAMVLLALFWSIPTEELLMLLLFITMAAFRSAAGGNRT